MNAKVWCSALLACAGVFLFVPYSDAQPRRESRPAPVASPHVQILVRGVARPTYWAHGQKYVEGRIGARYVVRVHNPTWRRVEAVVAVDGRDVIDGHPASLHKRGYVLGAHGYVDIDGFRLSDQSVAAFRFSRVGDSYAAKMGTPWRVGAVDVALFPERARPKAAPPVARRKSPESRPGGASDRSSASRGLGTEFGERRFSPVRTTSFVRESWHHPRWRMTVHYDDRDGLCERGVLAMCPVSRPGWRHPGPFAEPPPGWPY